MDKDANDPCACGHNRLNHEAHAPIDAAGVTPNYCGALGCECQQFEMRGQERLGLALQTLRDIVNPIGRMKRELPEGHQLNGMGAVMLSEDPNYLKGLAQDALRRIG